MDIVAHRRECDRLLEAGHRVEIAPQHITNGFNQISEELIQWLLERGYSTGGITPDPYRIWAGSRPNARGPNAAVIFHPDQAQDAMLFKLTWA